MTTAGGPTVRAKWPRDRIYVDFARAPDGYKHPVYSSRSAMYLCVMATAHIDVDVDKLTGDFSLSEIACFNPLNRAQYVMNTFHNTIIL